MAFDKFMSKMKEKDAYFLDKAVLLFVIIPVYC